MLEDLRHRLALGHDGFGFDADLVAGGVDGVLLVGETLVSEGAEVAVLAETQDLSAGP